MDSQFTELAPYLALASLVVALASLVAAAIALLFAFRGDLRKTGIDIRYDLKVTTGSIWANDQYVSEVSLENVKDRSVSIYKIYLELGHGLFIEIEDFTESPLTLDAYSLYQNKHDPIEFYSSQMSRIKIDLDNRRVRRRILLTTSQGRYYPKRGINRIDDPFFDTITKNITTVVAVPFRLLYHGRSHGSKAKYVVTLTGTNGKEELIPVYIRSHEISPFRNFRLTKESLESKESLENFLQSQADEGNLSCEDFKVFDLEPLRREVLEEYSSVVTVVPRGWFIHKVLGRCITIWEKWKLHRKNKKIRSGTP